MVRSGEKNFDLEARANMHKYHFSVCNTGKFELELDIYFPYAENVEEVFTKYFLNEKNIQKTSNLYGLSPSELSAMPGTHKNGHPRMAIFGPRF